MCPTACGSAASTQTRAATCKLEVSTPLASDPQQGAQARCEPAAGSSGENCPSCPFYLDTTTCAAAISATCAASVAVQCISSSGADCATAAITDAATCNTAAGCAWTAIDCGATFTDQDSCEATAGCAYVAGDPGCANAPDTKDAAQLKPAAGGCAPGRKRSGA